eukprot:2370960-Rhodomonas_salina.3
MFLSPFPPCHSRSDQHLSVARWCPARAADSSSGFQVKRLPTTQTRSHCDAALLQSSTSSNLRGPGAVTVLAWIAAHRGDPGNRRA